MTKKQTEAESASTDATFVLIIKIKKNGDLKELSQRWLKRHMSSAT